LKVRIIRSGNIQPIRSEAAAEKHDGIFDATVRVCSHDLRRHHAFAFVKKNLPTFA
jgi:hypothetical protein